MNRRGGAFDINILSGIYICGTLANNYFQRHEPKHDKRIVLKGVIWKLLRILRLLNLFFFKGVKHHLKVLENLIISGKIEHN